MDVFINCPVDSQYTPLLRVITFVLLKYEFSPRIALEDTDSVTNRLQKIVRLISESVISIHDLSRVKSSKKSEYSRMNMPFELGIDYGIKVSSREEKRIVVLEEEKYSFHKGLSDYSGFDILCHKGDPELLAKILRDWFVNNNLVSDRIGGTALWYEYTDCWAYLYEELLKRGYSEAETSDVPYNEFVELVHAWLTLPSES